LRLSVEKSAWQNFINSRTPVGSERSSLQLNDQRRTRSCIGFSTLNNQHRYLILSNQRTYNGCNSSHRSVSDVIHGFDGAQWPKNGS